MRRVAADLAPMSAVPHTHAASPAARRRLPLSPLLAEACRRQHRLSFLDLKMSLQSKVARKDAPWMAFGSFLQITLPTWQTRMDAT